MKVSAKYIPCDCGGKAVGKVSTVKFETGGRSRTVKEVPAFVCENCDEVYYDGPSLVNIEQRLERDALLARS